MDTNDAAKMVKIAKICRGSNENWDKMAYGIMKVGAQAKFSQNEECKEYILSTGLKRLVEGSKWDTTWGVGIDFNDPRIDNQENWKGENCNQLGCVLMDVRYELLP